jgi:phosphomannomutase
MDLFGTAGIRGSVRERVTPELALSIGRAAGQDGEEFVVARDGRETGSGLAAATVAGLTSAGASVVRVGMLPTPALAYASQNRHGIMVTASHNPPTDNGLKLFADGTEYGEGAEQRVEDRLEADPGPSRWDEWGAVETAEILPSYRAAVCAFARQYGAPLDDLRIAVDCANGMASLATPQVLRELGAAVVTLNANVDGHVPGRPSKPTPESLADLRAFVADANRTQTTVDFGIGHDGDADRIVIVDETGDVVHEDTIVAILAEHYVRESDADDPVVVTTPNASARIDERVRDAGGRVERVALGYLHEGIARVNADGGPETTVAFAAEPWKHTHTGFGPWIDGVASAALVSRLVAASGLDALRDPVTERPYRKANVDCPDAEKEPAMERLGRTLPEEFSDASVSTQYGVRLERPDGSWVLVRPSGTEPYIRVYAESEAVDELVDVTVALVEDAVRAG